MCAPVFYKVSVIIDYGLDDLLIGILTEVYGIAADSANLGLSQKEVI
jgi:hypothetical protein